MNKKIIAVFCVVILMASVFSACGNKGYLLMKDEHGVKHAYVTDENGSTVLNEQGNIRVYETDKNGNIAKDKDGNPKENSVKPPKAVVKGNEYRTPNFKFVAPAGWKVENPSSIYIAVSEDGLSQIQLEVFDESASDFESYVAKKSDETQQLVAEFQKNGAKAEVKEGRTKITADKADGYYLLFDYEISVESESVYYHSCAVYFAFNGKICKAFYSSNQQANITLEQAVKVFDNLTMTAAAS